MMRATHMPARLTAGGVVERHHDFNEYFRLQMRATGRFVHSFAMPPDRGRFAAWALNERELKSFYPDAIDVRLEPSLE